MALEQLLIAPPPYVTFPWNDHTESEVVPVIFVQQLNLPRQWSVRCSSLLAVRRCVGLKGNPEVEEYLAKEWRP
jgi:hypothetical protein